MIRIPVDVTRSASHRSRSNYFSTLNNTMPHFTTSSCYNYSHTNKYSNMSSRGSVGNSASASLAMRKRG